MRRELSIDYLITLPMTDAKYRLSLSLLLLEWGQKVARGVQKKVFPDVF